MATVLDLLLVRGDKALHLQLADQIQDRILSGSLPAGAKLPTIRALAKSAEVSRVTVLQAYDTLQARGLVECRVGSGTYVSSPRQSKNGRERLRSYSACSVKTDYAANAQALGIVNLTTADADESLFHLDEFVAGMLRRADAANGDVGIYGSGSLLTNLTGFYQGYGVHCGPESLQVTGGGVATNAVLADLQGHKGSKVVLQDPCFPFADDYFASFQVQPVGVRTCGGDLDTDQFHDTVCKGDVSAAFLTLTANQATGESASVQNKRQVVEIAERYGVALYEDVSGFWVCQPGQRRPWLRELADGASIDVVAYDCMTKTLGPSVPIGVAFASGKVRDRIAVRSLGHGSSPSVVLQKAFAAFVQSRAMLAHVTRNLPRYLARRQATVDALKEFTPPLVSWTNPVAGFAVWVSFPSTLDDLQVYEAALAAGVGVSPGMAAAVPRRPVAAVRLSYSCAAVDEIVVAVKRLAHVIESRLS